MNKSLLLSAIASATLLCGVCTAEAAKVYSITSSDTQNTISTGSAAINYFYLSSSSSISFSSTSDSFAFSITPTVTGTYSIKYYGSYEFLNFVIVYGDYISSDHLVAKNCVSDIVFSDSSGTTPTLSSSEVQYVNGSGFCIYLSFAVTGDFSYSSLSFYLSGLSGKLDDNTLSLTASSSKASVIYYTEDSPTDLLTFTSVPEPASYAAIFGVAGLGGAMIMRRKNRRAK